MGLFEITVDGKQHSGSYITRADAERGLPAVSAQFPGKNVEVLERADGGDGLARYAGRDANGLPVTSVPLDAQRASTGGMEEADIQKPSEGMLPGAGGAVQTETPTPTAKSDAKSTTIASKK